MLIVSQDNGGYSNFRVRPVTYEDVSKIVKLHKAVSLIEGGIARSQDEVTLKYMRSYIKRVVADGVGVVCIDASNNIIGALTAYRNEIICNRHILENLTVCVHPDMQSKGVGKMIFTTFLGNVLQLDGILKVKLTVREANTKAVRFYEKLGFEREGILRYDALNVDGTFGNRFIMSWFK